ncbi:MAG: DUF3501 family protein, partial [Burkholderiaceae bacterium]
MTFADTLADTPDTQQLSAKRPRFNQIRRHLRTRTISLGPWMRLRFEDETTLRHELRERLSDETASDQAVAQACLMACARLLPNGGDWRATLLMDTSGRAQPLV